MNRKISGPPLKKRYLLVVKNLTFLYSHFWGIAQIIQRSGWEVWIAAGRTADPQRIIEAGMRYVPLNPCRGAWDVLGEIRIVFQTHRAIREIKPDVAHFIYLKNVLTGGILARINRVPAVLGAITGLGSLFADDRLTYRLLRSGTLAGLRIGFRHPNAMIALENIDDEALLIRAGAIRPGHTSVIRGSCVDQKVAPPKNPQAIPPIILCTSRMIRQKGIATLIEACGLLSQRGVQFELWLAGDVDLGNPQSLTAEALRLAETLGPVKWLGHRTDIGHLLQQCSVFCLPTYYREGLPRSLVEAAAAGRAIVTTDMPGCRDIVTHNVNGLLVEPRSVRELSSALERLLLNPEERERMGLASRRAFETDYTPELVLSAFNNCYDLLGLALNLTAPPLMDRAADLQNVPQDVPATGVGAAKFRGQGQDAGGR